MKAIALTLVKKPVEEINELHAEVCASAGSILEKAIRIGELLSQEKLNCKHGEWLPWLKGNVQFNQKTAWRYMRVYKERIKLGSVPNLAEAYRITLPKSKGKKRRSKEHNFDEGQAMEVFKKFLNRFADKDQSTILLALSNWAGGRDPTEDYISTYSDIQSRLGNVKTLRSKK